MEVDSFRGDSDDDNVSVASSDNGDRVQEELGQTAATYIVHAHSLGMIIKRNDVIRNCFGGKKKAWDECKEQAALQIKAAFGYDLEEVQTDKEDLVFLVEPTVEGAVPVEFIDEEEKLQKVLLFIILGYVTLKGDPVSETQLTEFLRKLHIDGQHPCFGDIPEQINRLTSQYYLKKIKDDRASSGEVL